MSYIIKDNKGNPIIQGGQKMRGSDSPDAVVRDIEPRQREFTICASSDNVDRLGDRIIQTGIDYKNFNKNPCILWAHEMHSIPIGRCVRHWMEQDGKTTRTMMRIKMSEAEDASKVFDAVKNGYLRSASVGFIPNYPIIPYD